MNALLLDAPSARPATPAEGAVAAAAAMVDPIGLDELMALAELQTRVDRKYAALCRAYRQDLPAGLRATLVTTYRRTTFVSRSGAARLTCDVGLRCLDMHHEVRDTGAQTLRRYFEPLPATA
jgi:VTC domain